MCLSCCVCAYVGVGVDDHGTILKVCVCLYLMLTIELKQLVCGWKKQPQTIAGAAHTCIYSFFLICFQGCTEEKEETDEIASFDQCKQIPCDISLRWETGPFLTTAATKKHISCCDTSDPIPVVKPPFLFL